MVQTNDRQNALTKKYSVFANPDHHRLVDEIQQAARSGDVALLQTQLKSIPNDTLRIAYINLLDDTGSTPLHNAVHFNHMDIVRLLICAGANINSRSGDAGQTPLHFACRRIHVQHTPRPQSQHSNTAIRPVLERGPKLTQRVVRAPHSSPSKKHFNKSLFENKKKIKRRSSSMMELLPLKTATDFSVKLRDGNGIRKRRSNSFDLPRNRPQPFEAEKSKKEHEEISMITLLLSLGAEPNARDRLGHTPLHVAVSRNNQTAVRDLLHTQGKDSAKQVRVEVVDQSKQNVLHIAALQCRTPKVIGLLLRNATCRTLLRTVDNHFNTPLHLACAQGNLATARVLLITGLREFGVKFVREMLSDRDDENQVPLLLAVEGGHNALVRLLIREGSPVDYGNDQGDCAIHIAAKRGDLDLCRVLVDSGYATVNVRNARGQTPLHRAATMNRVEVVEYLLANLPQDVAQSIEAKEWQNSCTPLLLAAQAGHVQMIQKLLELGANVYAVDKSGRNSVFLAAANDKVDAVKLLLDKTTKLSEHGESLSLLFQEDHYGYLPIHTACLNGHVETVLALLGTGRQRRSNVRRLFQERLEDDKMPLHLAALGGWHDLVKVIILLADTENVAIVNAEDDCGNTPLHLAALKGHETTCSVLLSRAARANVSARNSSGFTPLDCAASNGHVRVCRMLLAKSEDLVYAAKHVTPLHRACMSASSNGLQTVRLLVECSRSWHAHAAICARDIHGENCLDYAIDFNRPDIVNYLLHCKQWLNIMRNEQSIQTRGKSPSDDFPHYTRMTPMRKLILRMPEMAYVALNKCIEMTTNSSTKQVRIKCLYEFIDDTFVRWPASPYESGKSQPYSHDRTVLRNNHPLQLMLDQEQEALLTHPLTTSLLQTKWKVYGRYLFYFRLFTYSFFVLCLTAYCMSSNPVNRLFYADRNSKNQTYTVYWYSDFCIDVHSNRALHWPLSPDVNELTESAVCAVLEYYKKPPFDCSMEFLKLQERNTAFFVFFSINQFVLPILCVALLCTEIIQACILRRLGNILSCPLYICTIIVAVPWQGFTCFNSYGFMPSWEWQLSAFTLFLAYIQLTNFLRYFPWIGLHVQMLRDVSFTVMSFFPVFFLAIMAFALGFYIAFKSSVRHVHRADFFLTSKDDPLRVNPFYSVPIAVIKTLTMITGEYEQEKHLIINREPIQVWLHTIFTIIGTVVIVNLIIGLSVGNIKVMQEKASLRRIALRIDLILSAERLMPLWLLQRMWRKQQIFYIDSDKDKQIYASNDDENDEQNRKVKARKNMRLNNKTMTNLYRRLFMPKANKQQRQNESDKPRPTQHVFSTKPIDLTAVGGSTFYVPLQQHHSLPNLRGNNPTSWLCHRRPRTISDMSAIKDLNVSEKEDATTCRRDATDTNCTNLVADNHARSPQANNERNFSQSNSAPASFEHQLEQMLASYRQNLLEALEAARKNLACA